MTTSAAHGEGPGLRPWIGSTAAFATGSDLPSRALERYIASIEAQEPSVGAFVCTNLGRARADATASDARWAEGAPLSPIDGMPVGIKDVMETADMPTEQGSPLFAGWNGGRDSAAVVALREAGALIVGKTVTTEFAATDPRGTRNPWDLERTPGGSSSGSAAAVGSGMLPAALGTQVIGSIIRPASFCGAFGFKPSFGAINRGGSFDVFSQSSTGVIGASLEDTWAVARAMSARVGGDPGYAGLTGPLEAPAARTPRRMAFLRTEGWEAASPEAVAALTTARRALEAAGIAIADASSDADVAGVEDALAESFALSRALNGWEGRWLLRTYAADMDASLLSEVSRDRLAIANAMSHDEYLDLLDRRRQAREVYSRLRGSFDGVITLAAAGAAPRGLTSTGDPSFTVWTSWVGAPTVSLPVLRAEGLPLGLQVVGHVDEDAELFAIAAGVLALLPQAV